MGFEEYFAEAHPTIIIAIKLQNSIATERNLKYKLNQNVIIDIYGSKVFPDLLNTKIQIEILTKEMLILQIVEKSKRVYTGKITLHKPHFYICCLSIYHLPQ